MGAVLRGKGGKMSDHPLVEGRVRVELGCKGNRRVEGGRQIMKFSKLNVASRSEEGI